jgi:hypothetical protein
MVERVKAENLRNVSASKHKLVEPKLKDRYQFDNGLQRNRNQRTAAATYEAD